MNKLYFIIAFSFLYLTPFAAFSGNGSKKRDFSSQSELRKEGIKYLKNKQPDRALSNFQQALLNDPYDSQAQLDCGVACSRLSLYASAIYYYKNSINLYDDCIPCYDYLGQSYLNINEDSLAMRCFDTVLEMDADRARTYISRGNLLKNNGKLDEALADFRRGNQLNGTPVTQFNIGVVHYYMSNLDSAECYLDKALVLKPDYADCYLLKAYIAKKKDAKSPEIAIFAQKALELYSDDMAFDESVLYNVFSCRGDAYGLTGNNEKMNEDLQVALRRVTKLIELYPRAYIFWSDRGGILESLGDKKAAVVNYKKSLEINPRNLITQKALNELINE